MKRNLGLLLLGLCLAVSGAAQGLDTFKEIREKADRLEAKRPVIIIPGILGSELINKHSGEKVWFSYKRSKNDDLKLPIAASLQRNRDNLVPGDILRSVRFLFSSQDFYGSVTKAMTEHGGYEEASFSKPPESLKNKYFVFAYDWRRDNVEAARSLIRKMRALKKKSGERSIKFDIVAHSMGGIIARYAAMYGDRDLSPRKPRPNWAGGHHINKIMMFGTPNHGSADSLQVLLEGYGAVRGINIPFVRDLSPQDVFTMPSMFQLLPHSDQILFYDENLNRIEIDLYDYRTWEKYGWSIYGDRRSLNEDSEGEIARMEIHLENVLLRAKKFQSAIDADGKGLVKMYAFGSECDDTLSAFVLRKDSKSGNWRTLSKPTAYKTAQGKEIDPVSMREVMFKPGDGRVSKDSLLSRLAGVSETYFACSKHSALLSDTRFQRRLLSNLVIENAQ